MRGIRTSILSLILSMLAFAAPADYLPLEVGNSWVYRSEGRLGTQGATVEVLRSETTNDTQWFVTRFFGREVLLRITREGSLVSYDSESKVEKLWIPFATAEGESFDTAIEPCTQSGSITTKGGEYKGPVGESAEALVVSYRPRCADAGVSKTTFLPSIGLAEYETTTIAGPVVYRLVYARTGVTVRTDRELSFGISVDSARYTLPAVLAVRLTFRNTTAEPMRLQFPSGQDYDIVIRNDAGESVYTWSADKAFAAIFRTIDLGPGERTWQIEIPLDNLKPGKYTVEGSLATTPRIYVATTSVDILTGN